MEINNDMILKWWYASRKNEIVIFALRKLPKKYSNIIYSSGACNHFSFNEYKKLPEDEQAKFLDCVITKIIKEIDRFIDQLVDMHNTNERLKQIEKKLGRPHKFDDDHIRQIETMYSSGSMSMQEIANKMGCSKATISRYLDMRR